MIHLQRMQQIMETDPKVQFLLADDPGAAKLLALYTQKLKQQAMQEQRQQAMAEQAQQFSGQGQATGGQVGPPANEQAPVQANELLDESMPTAGGGAAA